MTEPVQSPSQDRKRRRVPLKDTEDLQKSFEALIDGLDDRDKVIFKDSSGNFLPFHGWQGVHYHRKRGVEKILWDKMFTHDGYLTYGALPDTLKEFSASHCNLYGQIYGEDFPRHLTHLDLSHNFLSEHVAVLNGLPKTLRYLNMSCNDMHGSFHILDFPKNLKVLNFHDNKIGNVPTMDQVVIQKIPESLKVLDLSKNRIRTKIYVGEGMSGDGIIDLTQNHIREDLFVERCWVDAQLVVHEGDLLLRATSGKIIAVVERRKFKWKKAKGPTITKRKTAVERPESKWKAPKKPKRKRLRR